MATGRLGRKTTCTRLDVVGRFANPVLPTFSGKLLALGGML
jgi:hypothetical protein